MKFFKKSVALAGHKNKQTSVLSEGTFLAYVPLRSATERERVAFLIPCQGLRGLDTIFFANFQFTTSRVIFPLLSHTWARVHGISLPCGRLRTRVHQSRNLCLP